MQFELADQSCFVVMLYLALNYAKYIGILQQTTKIVNFTYELPTTGTPTPMTTTLVYNGTTDPSMTTGPSTSMVTPTNNTGTTNMPLPTTNPEPGTKKSDSLQREIQKMNIACMTYLYKRARKSIVLLESVSHVWVVSNFSITLKHH